MEKVKHTPGPWAWSDGSSPPRHQYGDGSWLQSQSGMVLDYAGCGSHECKVTHADARLIAAAPELLEAMQEIVCAADCNGWEELDPLLSKARAAIAKAAGEKK